MTDEEFWYLYEELVDRLAKTIWRCKENGSRSQDSHNPIRVETD